MRYSLLAYFYSLFYEASCTGVPVARPMFFDFSTDNETWTKYEQFMIGPALLVRPAFHKNAVSVPVYLPAENTSWYHFRGGHEVNSGIGGVTISVTSLPSELVLLLRGGFIVPTQVRYF
jgi:alpha-glucosidase (family GH31 glycosyl hydrolase)